MSSPGADLPTLRCPACHVTMKTEALERHDHGTVNVQLCFACQGLWFDRLASSNLAPSAVISLFKEIHAHRDVVRQPLAAHMDCPRCDRSLVLSFDVAKTGRFSYFRCPRGDGRFTPFFQFLREKQFVRSLTAAEMNQLRAEVKQVTCSQCGAPVDLELGTQCQYCHAPLSLLDADAVEKAVHLWTEAQARNRRVAPPGAVPGSQAFKASTAAISRPLSELQRRNSDGLAVDLIAAGIDVLSFLFESSR